MYELGKKDQKFEEIPSPMAEENEEILKSANYEKIFHDIFLELLDISKGYVESKVSFTNAQLKSGSQENFQAVYQFMEMATQRLERIVIVKRLCLLYGLHKEMDEILSNELELIYKTNTPPRKYTTTDISNPIAGER
jgi:hypothetical protein